MSDRTVIRAMLRRARIEFVSRPINKDGDHSFFVDSSPEVELVFNKDGSLKDVRAYT